jgi:hypothetical protein
VLSRNTDFAQHARGPRRSFPSSRMHHGAQLSFGPTEIEGHGHLLDEWARVCLLSLALSLVGATLPSFASAKLATWFPTDSEHGNGTSYEVREMLSGRLAVAVAGLHLQPTAPPLATAGCGPLSGRKLELWRRRTSPFRRVGAALPPASALRLPPRCLWPLPCGCCRALTERPRPPTRRLQKRRWLANVLLLFAPFFICVLLWVLQEVINKQLDTRDFRCGCKCLSCCAWVPTEGDPGAAPRLGRTLRRRKERPASQMSASAAGTQATGVQAKARTSTSATLPQKIGRARPMPTARCAATRAASARPQHTRRESREQCACCRGTQAPRVLCAGIR